MGAVNYNEFVVRTASVVAGLPFSIDAFICRAGGNEAAARAAHAHFLATYHLGDGRAAGHRLARPLRQPALWLPARDQVSAGAQLQLPAGRLTKERRHKGWA